MGGSQERWVKPGGISGSSERGRPWAGRGGQGLPEWWGPCPVGGTVPQAKAYEGGCLPLPKKTLMQFKAHSNHYI